MKCERCGSELSPRQKQFCSKRCVAFRSRGTPEQRFYKKVNKDGPQHPYDKSLGQCWEWTATKNPSGYGMFHVDDTMQNAHRVAFFFEHGRWPEPMGCHSCDNRACCNPAHIFEGDNAANMRDMATKGRAASVRLDVSDLLEIRELRDLGLTQREIGAIFGVHQTTIHDVLVGKAESYNLRIRSAS